MIRLHTYAALAGLLAAGSTSAATVLVTTTSDIVANDGVCSLREAVTAANTNLASGAAAGECGAGLPPPFDQIDLPAGSYRLQRTGAVDDSNAAGDLDIRRSGLALVGAGADLSEIRGDRNERVLDVGAGLPPPAPGSASVRIAGVTIRNGQDSSGGGIRSAIGWPLVVEASTLANNSAGFGGGIAANGPLLLRTSTLHGNTTTDAAGPGGGGLYYAGSATAELRNVTFNANESLTDGGAARLAGPSLLNNVTASGNTSDADFDDSGDGAIAATTVVDLANTLLAANVDFSLLVGGAVSPDCSGGSAQWSSRGYNLIGNTGASCPITAQTGDQFGTAVQPLNPRLLPFGPNGGTTETQMPAANSPAVDRGGSGAAACEAVDQRGVARPIGAACDIGAVESDDRIFADGFQAP
ncbi:choice-of-anchor Q domain-containing protein [Tahibacter caeni]|uniref:choice-of-anchor Q domain-containing protein n=1 Tax=Tahibacter caeni TaxID=1453545 RepID=UPI0021492E1B|nr:choice-of-anchor Q domain-containing protein [Tahibacter caeni]